MLKKGSMVPVVCTNILVIKLRHIGDVLLSTPVLRALREAYPDARLTLLLNRGTEGVLTHNPDVNEVLCVEKGAWDAQLRFVQMLRRRAFDCVIDLTDGDRSAVISLATGAPVRVGFNAEHRWRGLLYSAVAKPRPTDRHRVDYDLCALRTLGLDPKPGIPAVHVSQAEEQMVEAWLQENGLLPSEASPLLILLQPGARYSLKVWPHERFAQLADRLADKFSCRILLGGDQREREIAELVARNTRCAPKVAAGKFSLLQFAALVKRCALFVGNDGGAMHIAAAMGTPVVALFGPTYPQRWGPRGGPAQVIYKGLDCRACYHPTCLRGDDSCMQQITVDEVFDACVRSLKGRPAGLCR
ncbi:MAG: Lipopolysaccharide core heptosyltransferase III [Nitrospira sp.]|jgi:predicted lipopolysaccharide heptosyltransferase III|nr:MAG: Lipopolysaccharide core heptosyltransferase III [Nitrospira sp.]